MDQDLSNKKVLLLHGLTSSPRIFDALLNKLNNHSINYFAPTLTGHRNNPPYSKEASLSNYLSELDEYVNYLSMEGRFKLDIVGISFGALLGLMVLKRHPALVNKLVLISPPVEFRNISTRIILPFLKYVPGLLARHLGSIPKYMVSSFNKNEGSSYSLNSLSVFSKLRSEVLDTKLYPSGESLLIQSSFDHHINPYSLYFLKNKILGENSRIVLRDWGAEHNILNNEDALKIVSTFLLR